MVAPLICATELATRLADPSLVIVDVRHDLSQPDWGEAEYRHAHLPRARFAHVDRDLSAPKSGANGRHPLPSPDACAAVFGRLGIDATRMVVAYDQGPGVYAARLWWMLRWLGHENAAVLDGGLAAWTRAGGPVTSDAAPSPAATFVARPQRAPVGVDDVASSLAQHSLLLIDARSHERFRGDVEPIDKVAGRIPGAANRPHTENLSSDGTFKSAPRLREEFTVLVAGRAVPSVVHYCGSGITACHNALAMEVAGLGGSAVYPGSWSEWSADPSRPIARGDG